MYAAGNDFGTRKLRSFKAAFEMQVRDTIHPDMYSEIELMLR
jgi:hypothetical protein